MKNLLQHVTGISLVPGQIQGVSKQRPGMGVVDSGKVNRHELLIVETPPTGKLV